MMEQWHTVIAASNEMDRYEKYHRIYLALMFAYGLGLRLSEIADTRMALHKETPGKPNPGSKRALDGNGWDIEVLGKRSKLRTMPIPRPVTAGVDSYAASIGLPADVGARP